MAEKPNACEENYLRELAIDLDDRGFQSDADSIFDFIKFEGDRSGWESVGEFLNALQRDVWWHYGHVGDESERHIYEEAEEKISEMAAKVRRCRRRGGWFGARRRR